MSEFKPQVSAPKPKRTRNFALFTVKMFTQSYLLTPSTRPHNGASANEWVTNVWMMCCLGHVISPQK